MAFEGQPPRVLLHKVFEALKFDDFPEREVNSFRSRFHTQDLGRLVGKMDIEPNGGHYDSHWPVLRHKYITPPTYIRVDGTNPMPPKLGA
jgi:hypothetical protein